MVWLNNPLNRITMKKKWNLLWMFTLLFAACQKDNDTSISEVDYLFSPPEVIQNYLSDNYPDASVSATFKFYSSDTGYVVILNTSEMLVFNLNGQIAGDSLFPGFCDSTHHRRWGRGRHHPHGHPGGGHLAGGIPIDSLPASIRTWITAAYPDYTARHAHLDTLCNLGSVTAVMISKPGQHPVKLLFDTNNLFAASAERIHYDDLPDIVRESVETNYPAYDKRRKAEKLSLSDGTTEYRVFLHTTGIKMKVVIKDDGSIACEES